MSPGDTFPLQSIVSRLVECSCVARYVMVTERDLADEKKFRAMAAKKGMKKCPSCKMWVDKNKGCNAIVCVCGITFCWRCGVDVNVKGGCLCLQNLQNLNARDRHDVIQVQSINEKNVCVPRSVFIDAALRWLPQITGECACNKSRQSSACTPAKESSRGRYRHAWWSWSCWVGWARGKVGGAVRCPCSKMGAWLG